MPGKGRPERTELLGMRCGMSKPDATSAKSLEEIIASIRRTLAGEGGSSDRNGHAKADPVLPELPPLGPATGLDALLSDRLAGALNGGNGAVADDDDLADILAHDPDKARLAAKPLDAAGEPGGRWFAGHVLADPSREVSREKAPAPEPVQAQKASAEPAADQIELSRPEVLRASLPPLFGDEMEATGKPEPEGGADGDAKRPAFAAPQAEGVAIPETAPEKPAEAPAATLPAFASALLSLSSLPASGGPALAEPAPVVPPPILPAAPATPPPPPPFIAAATRATDAASPDAVAKPTPGDLNSAAHAAPAGGPGTRTLEQVIAELLEPVIRHWLDNNLPRMVEKVVREEVARSLAAERAAPKADA
ncbi:MAG: DUF2497 domain-containing protein [Hyphomicrobiaceae bacterium]